MPASPHRVWQRDPVARSTPRGDDHVRIRTAHARRRSPTPPRRSPRSGGKALAGGQSLVGAMKLRLAQPGHARRSVAASPSSKGIKQGRRRDRHRRDDAPRRGRGVRGRSRARFRRSRRSPRASAIARCATWARSAARSPTTIRRPTGPPRWSRSDAHGDHQQAQDRGRTISSRACTRRRSPPTRSSLR